MLDFHNKKHLFFDLKKKNSGPQHLSDPWNSHPGCLDAIGFPTARFFQKQGRRANVQKRGEKKSWIKSIMGNPLGPNPPPTLQDIKLAWIFRNYEWY